jgi:hypothetical protein
MFWMETRPTKSEIGKTQKMVKALGKIVVRVDGMLSHEAIPDTKPNNPVLDKLDSGKRVRRRATEGGDMANTCEPRDCAVTS